MTKKVLASSVFITLVAMGLPWAPTGPATASAATTSLRSPALATGCAQPAEAGEHCLPLSAEVTGTVVTASGRCSALVVLEVQLVKSVVEYHATWTPPNQTSSFAFSASGGRSDVVASAFQGWSTKEIAYGGLVYNVPAGAGAWMLGAGSGPAPCTSPGPGTVQAWGWTAQPVVRGRVTFKGTGGPAAGIKVQASCPSGGTTTSDGTGAYGFVLKPGACTIKPNLAAGRTSAPTQRVVAVGDQDITGVDFVVTGAPLKIALKRLETLRSGLAVHSIHYSQFPADFTAASVGAGKTHLVCQSGCTDITVTVVDPATGRAPDPQATVDASVSPLVLGTVAFDNETTTPKAVGDGFLCDTDADGQDSQCGTSLTGLQTDGDGQLHLRYWAPGVLAAAKTTLTVTARCDARPCAAGAATSNLALTVKPYEIYQHSAPFSTDEVQEMVEWATGPSGFTKFLESSIHEYHVILYELKVLERFESVEKEAKELLEPVEKVEPIAVVLEVGIAINEALEAQGMFAMFLNVSGLSPFGIGADPSEASASGNPSRTFVRELMNQLAVPEFLKTSDGGFWWQVAQDMHTIVNAYGSGQESGWSLDTAVYEVSHCDNQEGACGAGYRNDVGVGIPIRDGIQPELIIELTLSHNHNPGGAIAFAIKYDALAWTTTQPNLKGVIKDS